MSFYIINLENKKETYFEDNELIIGRQLLENCNDKRISRTHAIIRLDASREFFWLISTHTNPIFHRSFQDVDLLNVISKDDEKVVLRCEDKFGLLSDKYWFEIKQKIDFDAEVADTSRINCIRIRNVDEVNQSCNNETEKNDEPEENDENRISNGIRIRNVDEVNQSCITPVKRRLPDWMMSPSNDSRKKRKDGPSTPTINPIYDTSKNGDHGVNSNASIEIPVPNQSDDEVGSSSQAIILPNDDLGSNSNTSIEMAAPIRNDNELANEETAVTDMVVDQPASTSCASQDNTTTEIKTEIKDEPNSGDTSTSTKKDSPVKLNIKKDPDPVPANLRPSCSFGIRCYRRNPAHRSVEAHPGDSDYRRPSFPEPALGTPPCPFGSQCYRRNPSHFQQFSHPPSTNPKQNRRNLRNAKKSSDQNIVFSDEDSDDDFNGDSDSDEYIPGRLDESSESSISSINSEE